ncbi:MAG: DNA translocase FtsK 4TM domain-containing protein, partial [Pseudomonadales bacterium]
MKSANTAKTANPVNHHWVREGTLIALLAISAYLLLSLVTYNAGDPGWSSTGSAEQARNAVGITGAWVADVLFSLFGIMAYLFPVMLLLRCWLLFREQEPEFLFDWVTLAIRIIGFILMMVSATSLVALNAQQNSILPFGQGGMLGRALADVSLGAFNLIGSRLLLLAIGLFGMTIFADISWLRVMDKLGEWVLKTATNSAELVREKWLRYNQKKRAEIQQKQRHEAIAKHAKASTKRPPPKIAAAPKKAPTGDRVHKEKQGRLFDAPVTGELPPLSLLDEPERDSTKGYSKEALEALSRLLELKLKDFNVIAEVVAVYPGPVITRFEIQPAPGTKVNRISNLAKDLARSLAVVSVRVVEVIPGKSVIGIEIPN